MRFAQALMIPALTILGFLAYAPAQDHISIPPASIGERIAVRGQSPVMSSDWHPIHIDKAPSYCKPCFFYSGDFDPSNSGSNGLWNGNSGGIQGDIWTPFRVPKIVKSTGLFMNTLTSGTGVIDNPTPYSVNANITTGNGGTVVCSGSANAKTSPTGRQAFGLSEYTVQIKKLAKVCNLKKGTYWMNIEPQDSTGQLWYMGDVVDNPPPNHCGPRNIDNDSFFNSSTFGENFQNTGLPIFSVGVTCRKGDPGCPCKGSAE